MLDVAIDPRESERLTVTTVEACPLVERCRSGDETAWKALYDAHFDFAWRMARRLGTPEADTEDVVQESFVAAYRHLGDFKGGRFTTWLYQIIANRVSNRLRARKVRDFFSKLMPRPNEWQTPSAEGQVSARRTLEKMEQLLTKLSREKREAFALYEVAGMSHEQIAELTGTNVGTVRTRLHYARKALAQLCEEAGVEP